ncbi:MAG: hypothetical protein JJW01_00215 [Alphaproteobacteria bacterium]|nr:hypothetical protein [Rickettsiales bacterium]
MTVKIKVSKIFICLVFAVSIPLLINRSTVFFGILVVAYCVFLLSISINVSNHNSKSVTAVYYKSMFGSKSIHNIESIEITDLLFVNSVIFIGNGGSKININNVSNISKLKKIPYKIKTT